ASEGVSRLALSSTARVSIVTWPGVLGIQVKDQLPRPVAGCQVCPPSVETSTPATMPPPLSEAVPVIVTGTPAVSAAPLRGAVITEVGGVKSVDGVAQSRPGMRVPGSTYIS